MDAYKISNINPSVFIITLLMSILLIVLPRRKAIMPLIVSVCLITLGQQLVVAGLSFTMIRLLLLCGWCRIIFRRELSSIKLNNIDKIILLFIFVNVIMNTIQYRTNDALINRLGFVANSMGSYFLLRALVRDRADVIYICKVLAVVSIPLSVAVLIEHHTGRNLFASLGGVPEMTAIRDGRIRCQGPFVHPILAGTFGATTLPLVSILWWANSNRRQLAIVGVISTTIITIASASSGPALAYIAAIIAMFMWPFHKNMRMIKLMVLITLIMLQLFMQAPIWYLIGKMGHLIGGTGWHRSELIEAAVDHFAEWWLCGTHYTAHWMNYLTLPNNPDMIDITNFYIRQGVDGGIVTMILFIAIIIQSYKGLGNALRIVRREPFQIQITLWMLGASLFSHMLSFISVSYFDQMIIIWYLLLAMISSLVGHYQFVKVNCESVKSLKVMRPLVATAHRLRGEEQDVF